MLLVHLLKWRVQPGGHAGSWRATIREQRVQIAMLINDSPSLRGHPSAALPEEYRNAALAAADETGLPGGLFPADCPFTVEQVLDPGWFPPAA